MSTKYIPKAYNNSNAYNSNAYNSNAYNNSKPPPLPKPDLASFPTLNETFNHLNKSPLSFINILKKTPPGKPAGLTGDGVLKPGWVYIRRNANKIIEYKYGPEVPLTSHDPTYDERKAAYECNLIIGKWQWERDELNAVLGDRSPYWNMKTLQKMLDAEDPNLNIPNILRNGYEYSSSSEEY